MAEQQKYKRPEAPTKDQLRQMLAQAVRNTQPELNNVQAPGKKGKAQVTPPALGHGGRSG